MTFMHFFLDERSRVLDNKLKIIVITKGIALYKYMQISQLRIPFIS